MNVRVMKDHKLHLFSEKSLFAIFSYLHVTALIMGSWLRAHKHSILFLFLFVKDIRGFLDILWESEEKHKLLISQGQPKMTGQTEQLS